MGFKIGIGGKANNEKKGSINKRKVKKLSSKPTVLSNIILEANVDAKYSIGEKDRFVKTKYEGKDAVLGIALFTDTIGGFSSKTRNDEDKGSVVEHINSESIHHITTKAILDKNVIIFLPTKECLDVMGEYMSLFNMDGAVYHLVYVLKDTFEYVDTGLLVEFSDVLDALDDGLTLDELLSDAKEDKKNPLIYELSDVKLDPEDEEDTKKSETTDKANKSDKAKDDNKSNKKDKKAKKKKSGGGFLGFFKKATADDTEDDAENSGDAEVKDIGAMNSDAVVDVTGDDVEIKDLDEDDNNDYVVTSSDDDADECLNQSNDFESVQIDTDLNDESKSVNPIDQFSNNLDNIQTSDPYTSQMSSDDVSVDNTSVSNVNSVQSMLSDDDIIAKVDGDDIIVNGERYVKNDHAEYYVEDADLRIKLNVRNMFTERYVFPEPHLFDYNEMLKEYTQRGDDWFSKNVSLLCLTQNNEFLERREQFKNSLYVNFRSNMDDTLSLISSMYSITTADTTYGAAIAQVNTEKFATLDKLDDFVKESQENIKNEYNRKKEEWVLAQSKILENNYDLEHGFELTNRLDNVTFELSSQINEKFDTKVSEIKENRFIDARRAIDLEVAKVNRKFKEAYEEYLSNELKEFAKVKDEIKSFVENNRVMAKDNLLAIQESIQADRRIEEEKARHEKQMEQLKSNYDTELSSVDIRLKSKIDDYDRMVAEYQAKIDKNNEDNRLKLQRIVEENNEQISRISDKYAKEVESIKKTCNDEVDRHKMQVESLITSMDTIDAKNKNYDRIQSKMLIIVVVASVFLAAAGFFLGNVHGMKTAYEGMSNTTTVVSPLMPDEVGKAPGK